MPKPKKPIGLLLLVALVLYSIGSVARFQASFYRKTPAVEVVVESLLPAAAAAVSSSSSNSSSPSLPPPPPVEAIGTSETKDGGSEPSNSPIPIPMLLPLEEQYQRKKKALLEMAAEAAMNAASNTTTTHQARNEPFQPSTAEQKESENQKQINQKQKQKNQKQKKKKQKKKQPHNDMTIVVLSTDRFGSLRRLLRSLLAADYTDPSPRDAGQGNIPDHPKTNRSATCCREGRGQAIDLVVLFDRPPRFSSEAPWGDRRGDSPLSHSNSNSSSSNNSTTTEEDHWEEQIASLERWIESEWNHGAATVSIGSSGGSEQAPPPRENDTEGGKQHERQRPPPVPWTPRTDQDRALILDESDPEVPVWYYRWLSEAHDRYGPTSGCLERNGKRTERGTLIPDLASIHPGAGPGAVLPEGAAPGTPFLHPLPLLGSHGVSPLARVWREFTGAPRLVSSFRFASIGIESHESRHGRSNSSAQSMVQNWSDETWEPTSSSLWNPRLDAIKTNAVNPPRLTRSFFLLSPFVVVDLPTESTVFVECTSNVNEFVGRCFSPGNKMEQKKAERASKSLSPKRIATPIDAPGFVERYEHKHHNKRHAWMQRFASFCQQKQLYSLYQNTATATNESENANATATVTATSNRANGTFPPKESLPPLLQHGDAGGGSDGSASGTPSFPSATEFPAASALKRYDLRGDIVETVDHLDPGAPPFRSVALSKEAERSNDRTPRFLPPVVMSAAIGYSLKDFRRFVGPLREFYFGDVWLLIARDESGGGGEHHGDGNTDSPEEPASIRRYLKEHNVHYLETDSGTSNTGKGKAATTGSEWERINRDRFGFFSTVCDPDVYSLCLTTDFRDSVFQSNPFANLHELLPPPPMSPPPGGDGNGCAGDCGCGAGLPSGVLHVFEHNHGMNEWHYNKMKEPACGLYEQYGKVLKGTKIVNGGSIIGSPHAFRRIGEYMAHPEWGGCNDQVVLNVLVRAPGNSLLANPPAPREEPELQTGNDRNTKYDDDDEKSLDAAGRCRRCCFRAPLAIAVTVHKQGFGPMNVVGRGGRIVKRGEDAKFMNRNCIVSPVVHQYDLIKCPGKKKKKKKKRN
ncbi:unnamed protein product [Pseudo-nitzschia multistriata]|uniref:Uncharacterized protein n=1 Tax=Pseudo-nitzschia multistriata TaxID=183589 RepID=A0A448YWY5_9STRA|nr:unnamed protein product [Pseudo-nitzschia multistriata]